jgi:hypothetical protein
MTVARRFIAGSGTTWDLRPEGSARMYTARNYTAGVLVSQHIPTLIDATCHPRQEYSSETRSNALVSRNTRLLVKRDNRMPGAVQADFATRCGAVLFSAKRR